MYPHVRAFGLALFVQVLQRAVQLGIVLVSHEETSERLRERCAEPAPAVLHEPADEGGRDRGEFVVGEAPVADGRCTVVIVVVVVVIGVLSMQRGRSARVKTRSERLE